MINTEVSFGSWVKRRRRALDMTQQDLARRVGCSNSAIFKIESDERRPSRQIAELLAEYLQIPPDQRELFLKVARQERGTQNLDLVAPLSTPQPVPVSHPTPAPLPLPATSLVGREHELRMVIQQMQSPTCRLLTLTGPGGVGKTRLALEVAHRLRDSYEQNICFVSLVVTSSPEDIVPAMADSLGFAFSGTAELKTQLFHYLKDRRILLVLDNLEHLLNGIEFLDGLLALAPEVKILATSREPLNLRSEWSFEVHGLPVPVRASLQDVESNSALALFLQRSRQVRSDFQLTAADLEPVERICQLVDGLPLGIELASSWVRVLSCREIAQEIERNMDILTATARDVPPRHRSMRAVFDYSWSLLSTEEQDVMMRLSTFRGGFTREAAGQVAGASLHVLSALVDKSLVQHGRDSRFDLHELVRHYAREQLAASGRLEVILERHFAYFLAFAEESRRHLHGTGQRTWLNNLEEDYDNLRAALEWSLRYEDREENLAPAQEQAVQEAIQLAGALYIFWWMRNYWSEGRKWLQRVLDLHTVHPVTRYRFRALNAAVILAVGQGDLENALQLADENFQLASDLADPQYIAYAHQSHGIVLWRLKEYAAANEQCERALALFRNLNDRPAVAGVLQTLGILAIQQDRLAEAETYLEECASIFKSFGDTIEYNTVLSDLGLLAYLSKDLATARSHQEKSLVLFREVGHLAGIEMALNRLGDVARCENHYPEAEKHYKEALEIFRESGDQEEIAILLHNLGCVAQVCGEPSRALSLFREALRLQSERNNQAGMAQCLAGIAFVSIARGKMEAAARLLGAAEAARERAGAKLWPADSIEHEDNFARLCQSLSEVALAEAWKTGRGMAIERAAETALQEP